MKLVDVNVWLAAAWRNHAQHGAARDWMEAEGDELAFCRITQMALLRLLSNPAITRHDTLTRRQAWDVFDQFMADDRARFVSEPHGLEQIWMAFSKRDDKSHLLWTDDYLAAFAQAADMDLVTFERAFHKRYPSVRVTLL